MTQSQMSENVAATLSYALGWVTGLIFYFIDKRPFVRFHAAQSIVVFGGLFVIRVVLRVLISSGGVLGFGLLGMLHVLIGLIALILWVLLMVKAYQHETFRVPIAAEVADSIAGKM